MNAERTEAGWDLRLAGELTQSDAARFKSWVVETVGKTAAAVALDCEGLTYLDSSGLGALVFVRKKIIDLGGVLYLTKTGGWLKKFLEVTGLEEAFRANAAQEQRAK
ncbi:MAG: STAS domain-containing protein [Planctomycetes bacterium]|nr:STAS domain-containing protein [Planctomycetota bacterium]